MTSTVPGAEAPPASVSPLGRRILVVCTANECRSPMAEGLLRFRLAAAGLGHRCAVSSAGTWVPESRPATGHAVSAMAERGIDISAHRSAEVTVESLTGADLVLVMTDGHRRAICSEHPGLAERVVLLSALGGAEWDVADPVGGSLDDYRATAAEIDRLLQAGWQRIVALQPAP